MPNGRSGRAAQDPVSTARFVVHVDGREIAVARITAPALASNPDSLTTRTVGGDQPPAPRPGDSPPPGRPSPPHGLPPHIPQPQDPPTRGPQPGGPQQPQPDVPQQVIWSGRPARTTVVLARAVDGDPYLFDWRRTALSDDQKVQAGATRNVEVGVLGPADTRPVFRYRLVSAWPVRWSGPALDALHPVIAEEELELVFHDLHRL